MIAIHRRFRQTGFSLIELMVAMVLGLLVAAGIISVFISTSSSNRAQTQLALLQEEGRYAVTRLKGDLGMANGQYCTGSGGNARASSAGPYLDGLRAPMVYANGDTALMGALSDVTTPWGDGSAYPSAPAAPYALPSFLSMRGYDCSGKACKPADPHDAVAAIPAMGKAVGDRVLGADVITLRYLDTSQGWTVNPSGSASGTTLTAKLDGTLDEIALSPLPGEPAASRFAAGDLAMLANCSTAQVFAVSGSGAGTPATLKPTGANFAAPSAQKGTAGLRLFDFNRDYQTVTYYLRVVAGDNGATTGALIRRVNGVDSELVRGVERLDFRYGVERTDGSLRFLTAGDVDAGRRADCPPAAPNAPTTGNDAGCLWRAVKGIEVSVLMSGQVPLHTLAAADQQYSYAADGKLVPAAPGAAGRIVAPAAQGFPVPLLRREFIALVSVRNYNP